MKQVIEDALRTMAGCDGSIEVETVDLDKRNPHRCLRYYQLQWVSNPDTDPENFRSVGPFCLHATEALLFGAEVARLTREQKAALTDLGWGRSGSRAMMNGLAFRMIMRTVAKRIKDLSTKGGKPVDGRS